MLSPAQCRAARALLDWTQVDLAERSGVARSTVKSFEGGQHALIRGNQRAIRQAFEAAGVVFLDADVMGPGVRLLMPEPLPEPLPAPAQAAAPEAGGEAE